jgi:rubrerythrin
MSPHASTPENASHDEPYFPVRCEQCGCEWHGGDAGPCPNCGASHMSYDAAAAREWSAWADDHYGRTR